jgi:hypothetical protein
MSLNLVDLELENFLAAKEPRVIALSGLWGRGKTYYWRAFLAKHRPSTATQRNYSYVSLFGVTSLSDLKDAIFANAVPLDSIATSSAPLSELGLSPTARGAQNLKRLGGKLQQLGRKHSSLLERIPKLGEFGPFARAAAFLTVADYIICIDDLERRSESLPLRDVLGLLTTLRDERQCRVIVILNTDALTVSDKAEFQTFREKVFDHEIVFDPTPSDCATIVFSGNSQLYPLAASYAIRLGISNIRVLYRIRRLIDAVSEYALQADDAVQQQIVHSSVLLGWCFNTRTGDAPEYEYVKHLNYSRFISLDESKKISPEEKHWNTVLEAYDYLNTDELDAALCEVLERGYVDTKALPRALADRSEAARRARLETAFHEAWSIYHQEFDPNPEKLAIAFESSMRAGAEVINIMNASATTSLLRSLGYDALADELMFYWIRTHEKVNRKTLDVEHNVWGGEIHDSRFRVEAQAAFNRTIEESRRFTDVALDLATKGGWDDEDVRVLAAASEDDYFELFKSLKGPQTRSVVASCLRFREFGGSSPQYRLIGERTCATLERIAGESELNRLRVESYGLRFTNEPGSLRPTLADGGGGPV